MYQISDLWDHCFVAFTNAKGLGKTEVEQVSQIQYNLAQPRCPESLKTLLNKVQQRYIVVESVDDMGDSYHATKMSQILQMVDSIKQCTPGPYTNRSFQLAFNKYKEAKEKEWRKEIERQEEQRLLLEEKRRQIEQQQTQLRKEIQRQEEQRLLLEEKRRRIKQQQMQLEAERLREIHQERKAAEKNTKARYTKRLIRKLRF